MASSTEHEVPNTNYEYIMTDKQTPHVLFPMEIGVWEGFRFVESPQIAQDNPSAGGYGSKIPQAERTKIEGAARKNAILGPKRSRWSR